MTTEVEALIDRAVPVAKLPGAGRIPEKRKSAPLPQPVVNAVYAGLLLINGPKGTGTQYHARRLEPAEMKDPENNLIEWIVRDPWGDDHLVVKLSEKGLHTNIQRYSNRVQDEIVKGDVKAASWFAKRVSQIVAETLLPQTRTGPRESAWVCA